MFKFQAPQSKQRKHVGILKFKPKSKLSGN